MYNINFDAAVFRSTNSAGVGFVVRNWRGELEGVLPAPIPLAHYVANMEDLACRRAVEFATELRLQRVIFEGDSTIVINAIIQGTSGFSTYGNVVEDIRCQATLFQSRMFNHVKSVL